MIENYKGISIWKNDFYYAFTEIGKIQSYSLEELKEQIDFLTEE